MKRLSPAMIVALAALVLALGGVGVAAVRLGANTVGTRQLRDAAVTNHKLAGGSVGNQKLAARSVGTRKFAAHAVGAGQIDGSQVQARISGQCAAFTAAASADAFGGLRCGSTLPIERGTGSNPRTVTAAAYPSPVAVTSKTLPGGFPYLALAVPEVTVSGATAGQAVRADCTLAVAPGGVSQTGTAQFAIGAGDTSQASSMILVVPVPAAVGTSTATVSCAAAFTGGGAAPSVKLESTTNAVQVQSLG